jgi:hypothetical protein
MCLQYCIMSLSSVTVLGCVHREYIYYCRRAILFLSASKILTPHPHFRPASVYRLCCGGRTDSPGGEGDGGGGLYFGRRDKKDCPLAVKYVLCGCVILMMCQTEGSGIQDYHLWQPALFISSTRLSYPASFLRLKGFIWLCVL